MGSDFQIMSKPIGPTCNLDCDYCYYLEKKNLFPSTKNFLMSDSVLESFIRQYIESQIAEEVNFSWQGGEPTLAGLEFFKKVVDLQMEYADGKQIGNSFQTNGILLNDEWGRFLSEYKFFVGISIDGPENIHDIYRKNAASNPSFKKAMRAIELLKKHDVEFNTLTVVNDKNSRYPLDTYNFLKSVGSGYIQFIPIVERKATKKNVSMKLIAPTDREKAKITTWSVNTFQYGSFLNTIFDEWVCNDVGKIYVQMFDVTLANWAGQNSGLCVFQKTCGNAAVIEHNGNLYSCDHFVYPRYYLGNILENPLETLMNSVQQIKFGNDKKSKLPGKCNKCEFLFACWGGCPKHRIVDVGDKNRKLNYLCKGYKQFFSHVKPYMEFMLSELRNNKAPANVMDWARGRLK